MYAATTVAGASSALDLAGPSTSTQHRKRRVHEPCAAHASNVPHVAEASTSRQRRKRRLNQRRLASAGWLTS